MRTRRMLRCWAKGSAHEDASASEKPVSAQPETIPSKLLATAKVAKANPSNPAEADVPPTAAAPGLLSSENKTEDDTAPEEPGNCVALLLLFCTSSSLFVSFPSLS